MDDVILHSAVLRAKSKGPITTSSLMDPLSNLEVDARPFHEGKQFGKKDEQPTRKERVLTLSKGSARWTNM